MCWRKTKRPSFRWSHLHQYEGGGGRGGRKGNGGPLIARPSQGEGARGLKRGDLGEGRAQLEKEDIGGRHEGGGEGEKPGPPQNKPGGGRHLAPAGRGLEGGGGAEGPPHPRQPIALASCLTQFAGWVGRAPGRDGAVVAAMPSAGPGTGAGSQLRGRVMRLLDPPRPGRGAPPEASAARCRSSRDRRGSCIQAAPAACR